MDLREALKWCYENPGQKLKVNVNSERKFAPLAIRIRREGIVEGKNMREAWETVSEWWIDLTDPSTTFSIFSIPEESSEEEILEKFGPYADAVKDFVKFYGLKKGE